ncbi:hypothetical protein HB779_10595 [Phyllobacterium sp. 628]|uniref:hypothetical protein n=1 Tax=Phyllobacterium sp. 628 TaxID=2718938 RepID=UPI0016627DD3|nr:hypothetical protein [Phyllobacterium sp. 628]QND52309.1 hypothetical protein HB779_10595 [Phyllobacterium sp. 628]
MQLKLRSAAWAAALTATLVPATAHAGNTSVYTLIGIEQCREQSHATDNPLITGVWLCEGFGDMQVQLIEDDLRFYVAYAKKPAKKFSFGSMIPRFNTLGADKLEWRLGPDKKPVATILRYKTDDDSILAIMRVGEAKQTCSVGYVSVKQTAAKANDIARKIADRIAPGFRCGKQEASYYIAADFNDKPD